jgi:hypothetical protein
MRQMKLVVVSVLPLLLLSVTAQAQQPAAPPFQLAKVDFESTAVSGDLSFSSSRADGYTKSVPAPVPVKENEPIRPVRSVAIGFKADTLGAGIEVATPLARSFNLRSSINLFSFSYPFIIDGVNYDARLHFKSSQTTIDWFPWHGRFHISPGILYAKNNLAAAANVGPGQAFELGDQAFINSVNDPVNGSMTVVFPHNISPVLMLGFGNIIPRNGKHLSIPVEFGAAYTGAAQIDVDLQGTACTTDGCVSLATNPDAQSSLRQEISKLNEDLKRIPVYPILSIGVAYHF